MLERSLPKCNHFEIQCFCFGLRKAMALFLGIQGTESCGYSINSLNVEMIKNRDWILLFWHGYYVNQRWSLVVIFNQAGTDYICCFYWCMYYRWLYSIRQICFERIHHLNNSTKVQPFWDCVSVLVLALEFVRFREFTVWEWWVKISSLNVEMINTGTEYCSCGMRLPYLL